MKVLWLTFIPSPYRISFFEELAKYCDLTVLFERESSSYRKGMWDEFKFIGYNGIVLKGLTIFKNDKLCLGVKRHLLNGEYDLIVISNPTSPTGIYAASILKRKKIPYIIESDGAFPSNAKGLKTYLKTFVMKSAQVCFSTAKLHDEYYLQCGVDRERLCRYPFTSLYARDVVPRLSSLEKIKKKKELAVNEEKVILCVGRFIKSKGFDVLISAIKGLEEN